MSIESNSVNSGLRKLHFLDQEPRLLALMLLCLHIALSGDMNRLAERGFMLAHLGFFLLWQPLLRSDRSYSGLSFFTVILIIIATGILFSSWVMALWLILVSGLMASRVLMPGRGRLLYGFALGLLVWSLLVQVIPKIAGAASISDLYGSAFFELGVIVLAAVLITGRPKLKDTTVDYFQGMSFTLLLLLLTMGSLLTYHYTPFEFFPALLISLGLVVAVILTIAIFWQSRSQESQMSLGEIWINYLLNIGTPLEKWLQNLIRYAENKKLTTDEFIHYAAEEFFQTKWISGLYAEFNDQTLSLGELKGQPIEISDYGLTLRLYLPYAAGSSLTVHARLLGTVFVFLYVSKSREQNLAQQNHLKAIYETGSKLTHDIKNNLQSLQTLTAIVASAEDNDAEAMGLLRRQLPEISARLQGTLEKLKAPSRQPEPKLEFLIWWESLKARYAERDVDFQLESSDDFLVYAHVMDTVIENLIENARYKRIKEPSLKIIVRAASSEENLCITVEDNGEAVSADIANILFKQTIDSEKGLGIGLYQSFRSASQVGYQLTLADNQQGCVRFSLMTFPDSTED